VKCPVCESEALVRVGIDRYVCATCGWNKESLTKAKQSNRMSLTRRRKKGGRA